MHLFMKKGIPFVEEHGQWALQLPGVHTSLEAIEVLRTFIIEPSVGGRDARYAR